MVDDIFPSSLLKLLAVLGLILLNAAFVAAEFAFVRLRDTQLEGLILKGHRRARIARGLVRNLEACVSAIQLGITFCGLATGAMVQPVFRALLAPAFALAGVTSPVVRTTTEFIVGFLVSTILLIVIGELVPKALAIRKTLPTALWAAQPLAWFSRLAFPLIWTLNFLSQWFLRLLGIQPLSEFAAPHTEEELRLLIGVAQQQAGATPLGRNVVLNALELRHRIVGEVMRPRQEIVALDTGASIAECLDVAEKSRYSRFPLCDRGDLDKTLGVVHIKDLYAVARAARPSGSGNPPPNAAETHGRDVRATTGADLWPVARKLVYVPETARLEKLLQIFLERKLHLAIVVDEYGTTVGLATLENILEELVGQIQDEFDQEKPLLARVSETAWEASGALPLHELEELVGEPLRAEGITTTSGWVTQRLGGFPKLGDTLIVGHYELRVEELEGPRVARLRVSKAATAAGLSTSAGS